MTRARSSAVEYRLDKAAVVGSIPTVRTTFKNYLAFEAAYPGNVGAMEMFKFYQVASAQQKALMAKYIQDKLFDKAWDLLKQVTGVELHTSR